MCTGATAVGKTVTANMANPAIIPGAEDVSYAATPADVKATLGMAAPAFNRFPLT